MPNRNVTRGLGGPGDGDADRSEQDRSPPGRGVPESRSFGDPIFRSEDAHLKADLSRYAREQNRIAPPEYGHDQNYRPGYHEGGSRFGFFRSDDYRRPQADQEFDPDYLGWRDRQLQKHDSDYVEWRREQQRKYDDDYWRFRAERREDFHQRFEDWRAQRDALAAAEARNPDDKL
jgi:hypothetical protein